MTAACIARPAGCGKEDADVECAVRQARVNASRTISDATSGIREHAPRLDGHLANAIRTGVLCSHLPEP